MERSLIPDQDISNQEGNYFSTLNHHFRIVNEKREMNSIKDKHDLKETFNTILLILIMSCLLSSCIKSGVEKWNEHPFIIANKNLDNSFLYEDTNNEFFIVQEGVSNDAYYLETRCGSIFKKGNSYIYNPGQRCENPWVLVFNKKNVLIDSIAFSIIPHPLTVYAGGFALNRGRSEYGSIMVSSSVNPKLRFEVKEFKLEIYSHDGRNMTKQDRVYSNKIQGSSFIEYDPLINKYMDGAYIFVFSDFIFEDNPYLIQRLRPVEFVKN